MSILTNFLKLVKPEKNDYVDVEEHISNNLDKIDEKMENFNLNKLDKGGYTGTAQNLLTEISKIASKTVLGRMIVGKGLTVDSSSGRTSVVSKNDGIIVNDNDIQLNTYSGLDSDSTSRPLAANQGKILDNKKANRYGIASVGVGSPLYLKIGDMPASIGLGNCGVSFILSGGNAYGNQYMRRYSVTATPRGYSGSGIISNELLTALDISGANAQDASESNKFILKLNGSRLELWFRTAGFPYSVSIDAISNTGFTFNQNLSWLSEDPRNGTYTEYTPKLVYHTGNFNPDTKFDKAGGTVTGDFNVSGATSFNKTVTFNGSALFRGPQIEIYNSTPYIDFHSGNSEGDYTTRLIDDGTSMHYLNAKTSKNIDFDKIVTTNDYPYIARRYDGIKDFDGTFGDFFSKHPIGVYKVDNRTIMTKLNIPSGVYQYGTMLILPASAYSAMLIFVPDNQSSFWLWSGFNVLNRPTALFTENYTWRNLTDKATIGLSNVENVAQVTDVRFTGLTQKTTWNTAVNTYAAGRVICGIHKDSEGYNIDGVYYATMQKKVKGTWYTLAVE